MFQTFPIIPIPPELANRIPWTVGFHHDTAVPGMVIFIFLAAVSFYFGIREKKHSKTLAGIRFSAGAILLLFAALSLFFGLYFWGILLMIFFFVILLFVSMIRMLTYKM